MYQAALLRIEQRHQLTKGSALEKAASLGLGDDQVTLPAAVLQMQTQTQTWQQGVMTPSQQLEGLQG